MAGSRNASRWCGIGAFALTMPLAVGGSGSAWGNEVPPKSTPALSITHHDLSLTIDPVAHRLEARDQLTLSMPPSSAADLEFTLAPTLRVIQVRASQGDRAIPVTFTSRERLSADLAGESTQAVTVRLAESPEDGPLVLDWRYDGVIHDPPREPRHLRFVTPSDTSGYIGPEGVYLSGESQWYPDRAGSLPTFRVAVTLPTGWSSVTHGRRLDPQGFPSAQGADRTTIWEVPDPTEALTLVANQFVRTVREWTDAEGRVILLEADLLPGNVSLAEEYLEASARYIEAYSRILGPYPFSKFAVVENFFPSGLGMPSFTLLGSGVIKRHYVQPYALGHEIVHSWIGNAVFNRPGTGNWVEGLTTYLANYYYDELIGQEAQAKEQRRLMLVGYAVYVPPDRDYPVAQFRRKTDQRDNAVGYQKAAMVFHVLRREIGEAAFWRAVRRLGEEYRGRQVDWTELEALFSRESGKPLQPFFDQWVRRAGAPTLAVSARVSGGGATNGNGRGVEVSVRVEQAGAPFQVSVPLAVIGREGARSETVLSLTEERQTFSLRVLFDPTAVLVDPEFHVFRRLDRAALPPMLNLLVTDPERTIVLSPGRDSEEASVYRRIVERLTGEGTAGSGGGTATVAESLEQADSAVPGSVLFLGPEQWQPWAQRADPACASRIRDVDGTLQIDGQAYEGPALAVLVSCPRRTAPGHVSTLFYGSTPEAAGKVARLLFFYGWQSYLVFRDGVVVARGDFGSELGLVQVTRD